MYSSFEIGDILKSNKFKWVYKIINIKNGVATLEDINKNTVRVRFTLSALAQRVKNGIFAHRPQM